MKPSAALAAFLLIALVYVAALWLCSHSEEVSLPSWLLFLPLLLGPPVFVTGGTQALPFLLISSLAFFALTALALFARRRRIAFAATATAVWLASGLFNYLIHI